MKQFIILLFAVLMIAGCREVNQVTLAGKVAGTDTTYVLPASQVPATEPHEVLVEEFTGQMCSQCPAAHVKLEGIQAKPENTGRVNVIAMYVKGPPQSLPPVGAVYDFRNTVAGYINTSVYNGKIEMPSAGIDRTRVGGEMILYAGDWASAVDNQLSLTDSLVLAVQSDYNMTTNTATIRVKVTYVYQVVTPQNLSIAVVEDSLFDLQEYPGGPHPDYLFSNVFRDMVTTAPFGDPLGNLTVKEPGRVFEKIYTYHPKVTSPAIKPQNCKVIAFINKPGSGGDYRVAQSKQCKLVP